MDILRRQNLLERKAKAEGKLLPGEKRERLISQRIARQNQSMPKGKLWQSKIKFLNRFYMCMQIFNICL